MKADFNTEAEGIRRALIADGILVIVLNSARKGGGMGSSFKDDVAKSIPALLRGIAIEMEAKQKGLPWHQAASEKHIKNIMERIMNPIKDGEVSGAIHQFTI